MRACLRRLDDTEKKLADNPDPLKSPPLRIEPFNPNFDRTSFTCGVPSLDDFCRVHMPKEVDRNLSRAYVLVAEGATAVKGYYTLSSTVIDKKDLPSGLQRKIPYSTAPALLLGRMAVDFELKGQGLGEKLLMDALWTAYEISKKAGVMGVVVDAKDEGVKGFYQKYGFIAFPDHPLRLYLPMKTIQRMFEESSDPNNP